MNGICKLVDNERVVLEVNEYTTNEGGLGIE